MANDREESFLDKSDPLSRLIDAAVSKVSPDAKPNTWCDACQADVDPGACKHWVVLACAACHAKCVVERVAADGDAMEVEVPGCPQCPAPTAVGVGPRKVDLMGMIVPATTGKGPLVLSMAGSTDIYMPCFSTEQVLESVAADLGIVYDGVYSIEDPNQFIGSFPRNIEGRTVKFIVDPFITKDGTVHWTEIKFN